MRIFVWFDYDDDPTTGLAEGLDHRLVVDVGTVGFGAAGLAFCGYPGPSCGVTQGWLAFGALVSLRFSYEKGVAIFSFDPAKLARQEPFRLGRLKRFRFWIAAESGVRFDPVARRWDFTDWRRYVAPTDPLPERCFPTRDQFCRAVAARPQARLPPIHVGLNRSVAARAASRIASLPVWPESPMTRSSASGHACASSHAVPTGEPKSRRRG